MRGTTNVNLPQEKGCYIDYTWGSYVIMGHQVKQAVKIITLPNEFKFAIGEYCLNEIP